MVWGKPDHGLCWYGQQTSWYGERLQALPAPGAAGPEIYSAVTVLSCD